MTPVPVPICHACGIELFKDYPGQTLFVVEGGQVHGRCWRWKTDARGALIRVVKKMDPLEMLYHAPPATARYGYDANRGSTRA